MNKQKTNESMSNDTLNNVMLIYVNGPDIAEFDAARDVDNWVSSGKRRLESGHSTQQQKEQKKSNEMTLCGIVLFLIFCLVRACYFNLFFSLLLVWCSQIV